MMKRVSKRIILVLTSVALVFNTILAFANGTGTDKGVQVIADSKGEEVLTVADGLDLELQQVLQDNGLFRAEATITASGIPDGSAVLLSAEAVDGIKMQFTSRIVKKGEAAVVTFEYDASKELTLYEIAKEVKLTGEIVRYYSEAKELVLSDWVYHIDKKSTLENGFVANNAYLILDEYIGFDVDVNVYASYYFTEEMYNDMVAKGYQINGVTTADYGCILPCMMAGTDYDTAVKSLNYSGNDDETDLPEDSTLVRSYGPFIDNDMIESVTFYNSIYENKPFGVSMSRLTQYDVITADNIKYTNTYPCMLDNEDIQDYLDDGFDSIELDADGNNVMACTTYTDVYSMKGMFAFCDELRTVNNIPDNVNIMTNTFRNCSNLDTVSNLPAELIDMEKTFYNCTYLVDVPQLPQKVVNMMSAFKNCKRLNPREAFVIPSTVKNLMETFRACQAMEKTPIIDPYTRVYNLYYTFYNCKAFTELPILPMSAIGLFRTFNGCVNATKIQGDNPHIIGNYSNLVITEKGILGSGIETHQIDSADIITTLPSWQGLNMIDTYRGCKVLKADIYLNSEHGFYWVGSNNPSYGYFDRYGYAPIYTKNGNPVEAYENDGDYFYVEEPKYYLSGRTALGMFWETSLDTSGVAVNDGIQLYSNDASVLNDLSTKWVSRGENQGHVSDAYTLATGATVITANEVTTDDILAKKINYTKPALDAADDSVELVFNLSARIANAVSYYNEDGSLIETVRVPQANTTASIASPVKGDTDTGHSIITYTFDGWAYKNNTAEKFDFTAAVLEDVDLIATYTEQETFNEYTVTFYDEDKTTVLDSATVEWGSAAETSVIPQKEGESSDTEIKTYTFAGWVDAAGNSADLGRITGDTDVFASYTETVVTVREIVLDRIAIVTPPEKVVYKEKETFVKDKMKVDATYIRYWTDGHTDEITVRDVAYVVDETTPLVEADTKVEVSYTDGGITKTAQQPIEVKPYIESEVLDSIKIVKEPDKTKYLEKETFEKKGMQVDAVYKVSWSNGRVEYKTVENVVYVVDETTPLVEADTKVEVSYTNGGITKTAQQPIEVKPYIESEVLDSIKIVKEPDKTKYLERETFEKKGMQVDAVYKVSWSNGKVEYKTVENVVYVVDETTPLVEADTKVEVSYTDGGVTKTAQQPITVTAQTLVPADRFVTVKGVLRYEDGTPIANKKIELHSETQTAYTDDNGNYEFVQVETGVHELIIFDKDDLVYAVCEINVSVDANADKIDILSAEKCEVTTGISNDDFTVDATVKKAEVPDIPENPEDPDIPDTPENPENPDTPDTPHVPETGDGNAVYIVLYLLGALGSLASMILAKRRKSEI